MGRMAYLHSNPLDLLDAEVWTAASTGGIWRDDTDADRYDFLVAICEAKYTASNKGVVYGGARRMVLVYKLEGQDGITCRDIA